jgi:hypothetical protein
MSPFTFAFTVFVLERKEYHSTITTGIEIVSRLEGFFVWFSLATYTAKKPKLKEYQHAGVKMKNLKQFEVWFITGSQNLYGQETLKQVDSDSKRIAAFLNKSGSIPCTVVFKPVLKTA